MVPENTGCFLKIVQSRSQQILFDKVSNLPWQKIKLKVYYFVIMLLWRARVQAVYPLKKSHWQLQWNTWIRPLLTWLFFFNPCFPLSFGMNHFQVPLEKKMTYTYKYMHCVYKDKEGECHWNAQLSCYFPLWSVQSHLLIEVHVCGCINVCILYFTCLLSKW